MNSIVAFSLIVPMGILLWKEGTNGRSLKTIQGLVVLLAAVHSTNCYLAMRVGELNPSLIDQAWLVVPLLTSLSVTGRCFITRLVFVLFRVFFHRRGE